MVARAGAVAALGACLFLAGCSERGSARPPSVVVFLVDTLRADHLGCYGYERPTSPVLDAFAAEAVVFERCFAQSTWTKPTCASVLTGRWPSEHGAEHFASKLSERHPTLAEMLAPRGYRCAGFGRNAFVFAPEFGFGRGFERFPWSPARLGEEEARAGAVVDEALAWLDGVGREEPFLLYLHVVDPHAPYLPPPPFDERFDRGYAGTVAGDYGFDDDEERLEALGPEDVAHLVDLYDGEIAYTDRELGRFLRELDARGRADDVLFVFVADHGEEFLDHGGWRHGPTMYEELVRVPLVVRFPGAPAELAGVRVPALVRQIDVVPTVLDVLGAPGPADLPGASLLPLARGAREPERVGFSEVEKGGVVRSAVARGPKKYVRTRLPSESERLHDLALDPREQVDRAAEEPGTVLELRALLDAYEAAHAGAWVVLLENGGDAPLECELAAAGALSLERFEAYALEEVHTPAEVPDVVLPEEIVETEHGTLRLRRAVLHVLPGDRDGVRIVPAAGEERLYLGAWVGGEAADPALVRVGPEQAPAAALPLEFELSRSAELECAEPGALARAPEGPYRVRVWKEPEARAELVDVDPRVREGLEAIGYAGE